MRIYNSLEPIPNAASERLWIYNGLDCMVTAEVLSVIEKQLDETTSLTYKFSRDLQGPVLDMSTRGTLVDAMIKEQKIKDLSVRADKIRAGFDRLVIEGIGLEGGCSINSPMQLAKLFYDVMNVTPVKNFQGGRTCNEAALQKIKQYYYAEPLVNHILAYRELVKKIGTLRSGVDPDGRMRFSFGIAFTVTGRFSSYKNPFGSGTNAQNLDPEIRVIFIADPGKKLAYIDLEQAESRVVGAICWNLFHDGGYLDGCESSDLHTTVAKMVWPELGWIGDAKGDKAIAEQTFHAPFSYRDATKRLSHGSNYLGTAFTMSQFTKIPIVLCRTFQEAYFKAYPALTAWHEDVRKRLLRDGWIVSLMGRRRWFMGRRWDDSTIREAVAYNPQSSVADILNTGLLRLWRANLPSVDLLMQVHDAVLIQYDEAREAELLPQCMKLIEVEVPLLYNRSLRIPTEAKVGWNWGYYSETNPDGIRTHVGTDDRKRRLDPKASFMDRVIR